MPTNPVSLRPALARRAAVVAGSAAAAALFATVPAAPAAVPARPHPRARPSRSAHAVVPLAARPFTFNPQAVAAAAPAAVRTSAMHKALGKVGATVPLRRVWPQRLRLLRPGQLGLPELGQVPRRAPAGPCRGVGTPVSKSALQPGDLVFFYGGPSHVGIYIGNGKIVHASNPRHPVKTADMRSMPFHSARRI